MSYVDIILFKHWNLKKNLTNDNVAFNKLATARRYERIANERIMLLNTIKEKKLGA